MSAQIRLPLDFGRTPDFIVSPANADAAAGIQSPDGWPDGGAILVGPPASGKTLLVDIVRSSLGGELVTKEDWDRHPGSETDLFHALNRARDGGEPVLITARSMPGTWQIALRDLRSRIRALPVFEIGMPDDVLVAELLARKLDERGLAVPPDAILSAVRRIERSYEALEDVVDRIDAASLEQRKRVSVRLVTQILEGEAESR